MTFWSIGYYYRDPLFVGGLLSFCFYGMLYSIMTSKSDYWMVFKWKLPSPQSVVKYFEDWFSCVEFVFFYLNCIWVFMVTIETSILVLNFWSGSHALAYNIPSWCSWQTFMMPTCKCGNFHSTIFIIYHAAHMHWCHMMSQLLWELLSHFRWYMTCTPLLVILLGCMSTPLDLWD